MRYAYIQLECHFRPIIGPIFGAIIMYNNIYYDVKIGAIQLTKKLFIEKRKKVLPMNTIRSSLRSESKVHILSCTNSE